MTHAWNTIINNYFSRLSNRVVLCVWWYYSLILYLFSFFKMNKHFTSSLCFKSHKSKFSFFTSHVCTKWPVQTSNKSVWHKISSLTEKFLLFLFIFFHLTWQEQTKIRRVAFTVCVHSQTFKTQLNARLYQNVAWMGILQLRYVNVSVCVFI